MLSWTIIYLFWPLSSTNHLKVYLISLLGQSSGLIVILNQTMLKWFWTRLLNHLRRNQKTHFLYATIQSFASHLSVTCLTFIFFATHLVNLIDLVEIILNYSSYIHSLIAWFLSMLSWHKRVSYSDLSYLYNIYERVLRPTLSLIICLDFCQFKHIYRVKIHFKDSRYVHSLYLYKSECVYQKWNVW